MWSTQLPENVSERNGKLILTVKKQDAGGKRVTGPHGAGDPAAGHRYGRLPCDGAAAVAGAHLGWALTIQRAGQIINARFAG